MTNKEFLHALGMELKIARIRKGLTAKNLSGLSGLSEAAISDVEIGKTNSCILTYKRLADALQTNLKDIL